MIIRKAKIEDSHAIATYILSAMENIIYRFIGEEDEDKAKEFILHFIIQSNNQYSYENCWVAEDENKIIAAACIYDGSKINQLRSPVLDYIRNKYNNDLVLEEETQEGEIYLDSLGVDLNQQGKGTGSQMLRFLIDEYVGRQHQTLGLLVDEDNPNAKRLYLKLGFEVVGQKNFAGKRMEHLQITRTTIPHKKNTENMDA